MKKFLDEKEGLKRWEVEVRADPDASWTLQGRYGNRDAAEDAALREQRRGGQARVRDRFGANP